MRSQLSFLVSLTDDAKDNALENHLLLSGSRLEHWLLSYSQNIDNRGGSLHEAIFSDCLEPI